MHARAYAYMSYVHVRVRVSASGTCWLGILTLKSCTRACSYSCMHACYMPKEPWQHIVNLHMDGTPSCPPMAGRHRRSPRYLRARGLVLLQDATRAGLSTLTRCP